MYTPPNHSPVTQQQFNGFAGEVNRVFKGIGQRMQVIRARSYAVEAEWALEKRGRKPRMAMKFRSQNGEDAAIWEALDGQLEGLYFEVGAFDGLYYSVSYAFDAVGWDGLLVEAIPERYEQCVKNRPHAKVEHAALVGPGAPASLKFTVVEDAYGGMLSFANTDASHKQAVKDLPKREVEVPTATLDSLLGKHFDGRRLDFASIDVEGGELEVLRGFDLERWRPRILMLEDNSGGDRRIDEYMKDKAYQFVAWVEMNRVYARKDERGIMEVMMQRM